MKIGSLYTVHMFYWLLFPTKDAAGIAAVISIAFGLPLGLVEPTALATPPATATARHATAHYSRLYNCEVTCFSPDSIIVFLEEDGKYKKVLTSDGRIGWTWFIESYNECFEEVKTEQ